jgi:formate dehydrogenase iron-sulfur subunit
MSKAMLIDTTRCIGCRACQTSCKSWNNLPAAPSTFSESWSNPRFLSSTDFTRIIFREDIHPDGQVGWHFIKRQCMHCNDPACVSACPVAALIKLESGPVVYDDSRCIGCRYCMMACPFQIPKFQWEAAVPYIRKCTFCADRQAAGLQPACSATCPTGALLFGDRKGLIAEGWNRLRQHPEQYHREVYGEKIAGGTAKLYLTAHGFEALELHHRGFRTDLGDIPQGVHGREWMARVPFVGLAMGGLTLGLYTLNKRRAAVAAHEAQESKQGKEA